MSDTAIAAEAESKMMSYKIAVRVKEVKGKCAIRYQPGDTFVIERFYIKDAGKGSCLHALVAMLVLFALSRGLTKALMQKKGGGEGCCSARNRENARGYGVTSLEGRRWKGASRAQGTLLHTTLQEILHRLGIALGHPHVT